ncbi:MAG: ABC transporter substrate-binding protein [Chloroflexota bacterium]
MRSLSWRGGRGAALAIALGLALVVACAPAAAPSSKPAESKPTAAPAKPAEAKPTEAPKPAVVPTVAPPAAKPTEAAKPAARTPNGDLKIGLAAKLTTLDPHGAQSVDRETHTAMQHVLETLVKRDPKTGNIVPNLATGWTNPEPTITVFTLRQGVKFHDGSALSSADVKATIERVVAQKGPVAPLWAQVDTIETPDPQTVRIKTKVPVGTLVANTVLLPIGPAAGMNADGFWSKPIGTGPFKFSSWRADADLKLEANAEYWAGPPAAKTLTFKYIPEVAARVTAIETGELDFTYRLPPDQVPALEKNAELKIESIPSYDYYFIWFNSSREPFTDKRVRQAMVHAIDVDTIVKDLLKGIGQRATAPIPPTVFGHAAQTPYAYDVAKAKQLLAEAGKPGGFETDVIWYSGAGPQDREIGQALVSYWNAIGVKVKILEQERAQWLDNLIKLNWNMDLQTNSVTTGDADFTLGRLYHSRANRNGYKNPELDKILDDAAQAVDQNKRKELYAQANKIIWEEAAGIFPFDLLSNFAYRKSVTGFVPSPSSIYSFYDVSPK